MSDQEMPEKQGAESSQEVPAKKTKSHVSRLKLYLIVMLIFAIVLIAGFIWVQRSTGFFSNLLNNNSTDQVKALQAQIAEQGAQISSNQSSIEQLTSSQSSAQTDGSLVMAGNLVSLANFSLSIEHNVPATIRLLKQAELYLNQDNGKLTLALKASIANDISQLNAVSRPDVARLYLSLMRLRDEVKTLPIVDKYTKPLQEENQQKPAITDSSWHHAWHNTLEQLKSLVIIRHRDQVIKPIMTVKEQQIVIYSLRMLFLQAQWALLNHEQQIYVASLQEIQQLIKESFLQTSAETAKVLKEVDQVAKVNIAPVLPDISKTLVLAQALNQPAHPKGAEK